MYKSYAELHDKKFEDIEHSTRIASNGRMTLNELGRIWRARIMAYLKALSHH
jgi:hypothetical protein